VSPSLFADAAGDASVAGRTCSVAALLQLSLSPQATLVMQAGLARSCKHVFTCNTNPGITVSVGGAGHYICILIRATTHTLTLTLSRSRSLSGSLFARSHARALFLSLSLFLCLSFSLSDTRAFFLSRSQFPSLCWGGAIHHICIRARAYAHTLHTLVTTYILSIDSDVCCT
jgi:hypothetical protein